MSSDRDWSGKFPLVSFQIRENVPRLSTDLVSRFEKYFVPDVSDLVGRLYTMDFTIRPLYSPTPKLFGSAITVKCPPGDNAVVKKALQLVQPGDVVVIDAQGFTEWCTGGFGMLVRPIRDRGLQGLVVNGTYRDVSQARNADFPLFAKGVAPWSGPKRGPGEVNVPVCCGGVIVHPGDVIVGDEDGVAVVPRDYAEQIAEQLETVSQRERLEDWTDEYLQNAEDLRSEYFEQLVRERNGRYLD